MFGLFRKKKVQSFVPSLIKLPDERFAHGVKEAFDREPPATHAMAVVAYYNLSLMIEAMERIANEGGKTPSFDEFMISALEHLYGMKDEVHQRRFGWFLLGFSQMRLNQKAAKNQALQDDCLDVWLMMAKGGYYLKNLLAHNVVWKPEEKSIVSTLKDENDGVAFVTNLIVPKGYRRDPRFRELGQKHSFFVSPC